mmetsp:Transcript_17617/g.38434  ORF Transcript_17617/g.38434 Transcript_17617/m.38434 type:complete len:553 (-) Transcript_17617:215-1873(-)|eukprot:CAMPEP_0118923500 /NCGR_PEP_ID=MMETSP1169-20130426/1997_1 /TAXON_ID=36882 /ORGANISM="Pyramimonas obovata, Strain CCMP722" /LENGTH=552 /DNA_ID=CAMNT_0006864487 /DNA_START=355 /DNA_END=2013 /DNA_ORIENTATION=+
MLESATVWSQKLACDLIKDQFGDIVEKVLNCLVYKGKHTFHELGRSTGFPPAQLKNCILVLMQHNCVEAYKEDQAPPDPNKVAPPAPIVYVAVIDRIIQRLRHPRFMVHVRETMGEREEIILQALLEHGRLRIDQLLEYTAAREERDMDDARVDVDEALTELVQAHYVERAPLMGSAAMQAHASSASKRGTRTARPGSAAAAAAEAEAAKELAQQARAVQERFRLPANLKAVAVVLGKRRRGEDSGEPLQGLDMERDVLWRVNPDEFNRRFRHMLCVQLVNKKVEPAAGAVLNAILRVSREHELHAAEERSVPVSDSEIRTAMASLAEEGEPAIAAENVSPVLRLLMSDTSELVSRIGEGPDGAVNACANLKRIMDLVRLKEVEGAVRDRFGASACRIFRLLTIKRQLEQKQIAEMAMLPVKDTREILYRLLKAHFVTLQEVAQTADHNPQRTFYVWRVDIPKAVATLGVEVVRATCHVRARLAHELDSEKEVLDLLEQATAAASAPTASSGQRVSLTAAQRQKLEYIRRVAAILEMRIVHLSELIFLFHAS